MDKESKLSMIDVPITQPTTIEPVPQEEPLINSQKLPWPQDVLGITHRLRREGCRAIGRMDGKEPNLQLFKDTLRVLARHAEAKIAQQRELRKRRSGELLADMERRAAINAENLMRQERALQKQIDGLHGRLVRVQEASK